MMDGESGYCRTCGENHAAGFCKAVGKEISLQQELQMTFEDLRNFFSNIPMTEEMRNLIESDLEQIKGTLNIPDEKIYFNKEVSGYTIDSTQKNIARLFIEQGLTKSFLWTSHILPEKKEFVRITEHLEELLKT